MGSIIGGKSSAPQIEQVAVPGPTVYGPAVGSTTGGASGAISSLFQGQPVPPQPTGSDTSTQYPLWLQQYTANLANAATNLAATPYTPVPFGQVAAPSAATEQSWNMALNNVGNYQPELTSGENLTNTAANMAEANTGYQAPLNQALALSQQGATEAGNNTSYQAPLTQAMEESQAAAQPITGAQIASYMNPYENQVIGGLQSAANTNLFQNVMPQVQSQFVSAGQAASPQHMQAANNAVYQSQQALDQATAGALQTGYQGALNTALSEQGAAQTGAAQLGGLASTEQQLGASNINQQLAAGAQLGSLASTEQQLGASNINQIAALGGQQAQLGALTQQLGAADTGEVAAAGQAQDINNQANINAALNNFYAQQQWPYQNLAFASNIIRGQDVPSNTTAVGEAYAPAGSGGYTASPLSSFIGTTLGASALNNTGTAATQAAGTTATPIASAARGGHVRARALRRGALSQYRKAA